ncbi:Protein trichome birefringence-like 16 [Stylosanthes scabra]|uniref:Protein trichome birefringence-like 16 n=1 Tax=Stylosanthes scabra TaxID=79078 RepID=A0ABU6R6T9_9FABA|nr:Protein trichome birefringence-like 16 [Stylosanthes scabra]
MNAAEEETENFVEAEEIQGVPNLSTVTQNTTNEKDDERILEEEEDGTSFAIDSLQNDPQYEDCNYGKGKWVMDNRRPLYSGFGCKRWLSGSWSCRLTQRTNFAYENLRWQPKDCDLEEFQPSKFLTRMQDKTLAFVGDSLGRQQFQSLMCMISGGEEETQNVEDVGIEYGLVTPEGSTHPHGYAYRFISTNTTILYYWSSTLCDTQPIDATNPDSEVAMHLDQPPKFLQKYLHKIHVLVLNTGHHWNRGKLKANRWVMHVNGVPSIDKDLAMIWRAKNFTVHSVVSWVNSQLPKHSNLKVFFRTISPRHFVGGDWDTGGSCNNTTPMSVGKEIIDEGSNDLCAASAVKGTAIKLLDITALSQLRDEAHLSRFRITANPGGVQDCLHWCLPGVPDTWNEILSAQI